MIDIGRHGSLYEGNSSAWLRRVATARHMMKYIQRTVASWGRQKILSAQRLAKIFRCTLTAR